MKRARQLRPGFSLIEIMVAMTILSIVLMSLAKLATIVAVRGRDNDGYAKRSAILQMEANKFGGVSMADLAAWNTWTQSFTVNGFAYTRRLTITQVSSTRDSIKIVIVPSNTAIAKDSVILARTAPATTTALCKGC
jgi:prepilin-type N-terminal cleavage/methylation domain-containing protein